MKKVYLLIIIIFYGVWLKGQSESQHFEGKVSYVTSQSVYVKFSSTKGISAGDTLFVIKNDKLLPALEVKNLSSISCVCIPISDLNLAVSDLVIFKQNADMQAENELTEVAPIVSVVVTDSINEEKAEEVIEEKSLQKIGGRLSVSSYTNFSNTPASNAQRMRYTFSFIGKNLGNSKLSVETYLSFVHKNDNWNEIETDIFNGLKIYNLSLKYEFNNNTKLIFGRKINSKISNIGAVDGLQFEKKFKNIFVGAIAGSRPDYTNYSYDFNLFQFGAFAGYDYQGKNGTTQSTLAFVQQMNDWNTDRRFLYFQHANSLVKNLFFFGTVEFDLYKAKINQSDSTQTDIQNTFNLTNLYLSLRYRVIRQLSFTVSYSNRKNIIFYETYKTIIERLTNAEALQGFRFNINYRPVKYMSVGVTTGYRYRKDDPKPTMNLYGYLTYSRIPSINISATISATFLQTSYMNGKIYSIGISRDLIPGKLYTGIAYRNINYVYSTSDVNTTQNIVEINLSWNIYRKLSFSVYYEGTFDNPYTYNRIYANITQRF